MRILCRFWLPVPLACMALLAVPLRGDGPKDNLPDKVRPIPPRGIAVDHAERTILHKGLDDLAKEIASLHKSLKPGLRDLLPDVEVLHKAVRYALELEEFHKRGEVKFAIGLLAQARQRAQDLRDGKAPWTTATGLVVRGYRSKIDGSVQPYGLVVPASYSPGTAYRHRLDVWCHGRGETLSEVNFIADRQRSPGKFTPRDAFVLHPYGRYCNANKFAGEIDVLEALAHVQTHYPIDEDRVVMHGFSMGGASCWQFAVHYPDRWVAAAPGAGFSETPEFLRIFQDEKVKPTDYEKKLWRLYDCPGYAANLFNVPVVAYSGEKDRQKQAADVMARALDALKMPLVHIIGPNMGHDYHPEAKKEIDRRIDRLAAQGRPHCPPEVRFRTYTLRYNRSYWVRIDALEKHWEQAKVEAELTPMPSSTLLVRGEQVKLGRKFCQLRVETANVVAFSLLFEAGDWPLSGRSAPRVFVDGARLSGLAVASDRSMTAHFRKEGGKWRIVPAVETNRVAKRHGLQGPIDDAFMDSFLMVRPTGKPLNERVGAWVKGEMEHAVMHWRKHFRGDARVKADRDISAADIAAHNLVLWGDPSSNALLGKVLGKVPLHWDGKEVGLGKEKHDAAHHVPVLIYPNPLNPKRYVVVNSGFTFREYDYLNNARQVPKLPDYAILDVRAPASSRWPGKVVAAGFFDEDWGVKEP
jgi:pimeloyl-ACP methyl ester carboxylesterase